MVWKEEGEPSQGPGAWDRIQKSWPWRWMGWAMLWGVNLCIEKGERGRTYAPRRPMTLFWIIRTAHSLSEEVFFWCAG